MIPGFDKSLKEKMEGAVLVELMPAFSRDEEWARLARKLNPAPVRTYKKTWAIAAGLLLVALCGGVYMWSVQRPGNELAATAAPVNVTTTTAPVNAPAPVPPASKASIATALPAEKAERKTTVPATPASHSEPQKYKAKNVYLVQQTSRKPLPQQPHYNRQRMDGLFEYYHTKEFICNGTTCPLQICILQTIKCANGAPSAVATCSTLEPDQAGQLKYKINNTHDCNASIDEIRITRVNTGESIVLNSESKPSTAQDLFDYITGEKEGDLLTGIFDTDCNKTTGTQNLTIDKGYGNFIIK